MKIRKTTFIRADIAFRDALVRLIGTRLFEHRFLIEAAIRASNSNSIQINSLIIEGDHSSYVCVFAALKEIHICGFRWTMEHLDLAIDRIEFLLSTVTGFESIRGQKDLVDKVVETLELSTKVFKQRIFYECDICTPIEFVSTLEFVKPKAIDEGHLATLLGQYYQDEYGFVRYSRNELVQKASGYISSGSSFCLKFEGQIRSFCSTIAQDKHYCIGILVTNNMDRQQGFGTQLLSHVTNVLLEHQPKCWLMSDAQNEASNHVFKKVGYRPIYDYIDLIIEDASKENL